MAFKAPATFKDWYSEASDMFSMGVTSFEVASRKDPFDGESMHALALRQASREVYDAATTGVEPVLEC